MKITFCTYDNPTFHGGPNSWLKRLLPGLRDLGYEVELIFFFEGEISKCPTYQFFENSKFKTYYYPHRGYASDKIKWILQLIAQHPPDVFVPNMLVHAFYASRWIKQMGIPTIGLLHSDDSFHEGLIEEFVSGPEKYQLSALVCVSQFLFDKAKSYATGNTLIIKIPYGVPTGLYKEQGVVEVKRLIYVGRLVEEQKRISEVTQALCDVVKAVPGIQAILYGEGEREKVQRIIEANEESDRVKLGGKIDSNAMQHEMVKSGVIVLLSDYEGLPIALMEGMACGLIPVCLRMESGIPELVEHDRTGLIVKDRTDDFVDAIQRLASDPALCRRLSMGARQKIVNCYSSDHALQQWHELFTDFNKQSKKRPIKVPAFFSLPRPNRKLSREDFRKPGISATIKRNFDQAIMHFVKWSKANYEQ